MLDRATLLGQLLGRWWRVFNERSIPAVLASGAEVDTRIEYLYDGQMPVCEQEYEDGVLQQTRVHLLGGRGIEAVVAIDRTRGNQVSLRWLLYDGHGNLMRMMAPDYTKYRGISNIYGSWGALEVSFTKLSDLS
ncbi:MAG: hypothetical protein KatS3mg020_0898 [Fimbriimonadales bacterium]|nr:MAG: hypothetical protein KatS3mg020_0898 [Fimbriimonadales bacterium]